MARLRYTCCTASCNVVLHVLETGKVVHVMAIILSCNSLLQFDSSVQQTPDEFYYDKHIVFRFSNDYLSHCCKLRYTSLISTFC